MSKTGLLNTQAGDVRRMFARIAPRYDLMNRIMTAGQDVRWRREVIQRAQLPSHGRLLDLGAGTGALAFEALRQYPDCKTIAADYTLEMMRIGNNRHKMEPLNWCTADALNLPFPDQSFHAVVSGFLLRNVTDLARCLDEQVRTLIPGGWLVALDTTRPLKNTWTPLVNFHLHTLIPLLGRLVTGNLQAYTYLPQTTENFLAAEDLAEKMRLAGLQEVGFKRLMLDTIAIHWGHK